MKSHVTKIVLIVLAIGILLFLAIMGGEHYLKKEALSQMRQRVHEEVSRVTCESRGHQGHYWELGLIKKHFYCVKSDGSLVRFPVPACTLTTRAWLDDEQFLEKCAHLDTHKE